VAYEAVRELKNATVTGTPKLVEAFDDRTEWDFAQGTFEFLMLEKALLENEPLLLNVVSRDNKRLLKIELDSNNFLRALFKSPEIGTISRGAKINVDEVSKRGVFGPAVYIAFTWNLKEASTTLYVNGKPRDEL
jgi:hypothetical protein